MTKVTRMLQFRSLLSPPTSLMSIMLLLLMLLLQSEQADSQQAPNASLQTDMLATIPPTMGYNGTFRNNFCDLVPEEGTDSIGKILSGKAINVILAEGRFARFDLTYDDNGNVINKTLNQEYPGIMPRLLDEICERAGCTWRNSFATQNLPPNRTFDELLIWSTEHFDVSIDWWMRSTDRLARGITFTEGWYDASIIMITQHGATEGDAFKPLAWLRPFDKFVWLMILVTIVVSAAFYWLLEVMNNKSDLRATQLDPTETTWMFATAFAGHFEFNPQTGPARLLTFSIAFWSLLMGAAYTANLASFLVVKNTPQLQIDSLDQAVRMNMPMCIYDNGQTIKSVEESFPTYARSGRLKRTSTRSKLLDGIRNGDCKIAITEVSSWKAMQADADINGDCSFYWIGRTFQVVPASFGIKADSGQRCTSLVRSVFDLHLHGMKLEGLIDQYWEEHTKQTASVFCDGGSGSSTENDGGGEDRRHRRRRRSLQEGEEQRHRFRRNLVAGAQSASNNDGDGGDFDDSTQLTLKNMGGVFLLHGIFTALALLFATISWTREHYGCDRKQKENENEKEEESLFGNRPATTEDEFDMEDDNDVSTCKEHEFHRKMTLKMNQMDANQTEVNLKLKGIEGMLSALLDKVERDKEGSAKKTTATNMSNAHEAYFLKADREFRI